MAHAERVAFSQTLVKRLIPPPSGRKFVYDTRIAGWCICITASDTRTWYLYRKIDGKPRRVKLGRWPDMNVDQARASVLEKIAELTGVQHPRRAKSADGSITFRRLLNEYLDEADKAGRKTWRKDQESADRYLSDWYGRPAADITRLDVIEKQREIGERGEVASNRTLALISAVYNFGIRSSYLIENPSRLVRRYKEKSRDRFVQPDEMPRLLQAIKDYHNRNLGDYFMLLLLTGARRGNLMAMRWDEIAILNDQTHWAIPDSKNGEPLLLPLVDEAVRILADRRRRLANIGSPWVFPGRNDRRKHLSEPKAAWAKICQNAGISDLKIHDLRRTLGSWQAINGSSLTIIGASLGHACPQSTAIYARLNSKPVKDSISSAVEAMLQTLKSSD